MTIIFNDQAHEWLSRATGIPVHCLDRIQLPGSTSSAVFLIQDARDPDAERFVLRVPTNMEWLADEPDLAAHEAAALDVVQQAGLPAPRLIAYSSHDVGFGVPVVLMSCLPGTIDLRPANQREWLTALARQLAAIHRHPAENLAWRFNSWVDHAALTPPTWTTMPDVWERAIELWRGSAPPDRPVLIHRDYHPTNVLWHNRAISGVVDWVNACRGPAGVDVAHCRTNLTLMHGMDIAEQFLILYTELADSFEYQPYWDVDSILDLCLPAPSFYMPWQTFGLGTIAPQVLQQRADAHLERVMTSL